MSNIYTGIENNITKNKLAKNGNTFILLSMQIYVTKIWI